MHKKGNIEEESGQKSDRTGDQIVSINLITFFDDDIGR